MPYYPPAETLGDQVNALPSAGTLDGTELFYVDQAAADKKLLLSTLRTDIRSDRAAATHATQHQSGGADAIKLDDFATPDDNTDLNATTGRHGLLPKLGGGTANYLRADGTWATPSGGGAALPAQGRPKASSGTAFWTVPGVSFVSVGTYATSSNLIRYWPMYVLTDITIDRIGCEVTSAAAASNTLRIAIYNADTDLQPTSLVIDSGTLATDSTGVKEATVSQALGAGRYLLAINASASATLRAYRGTSPFAGLLPALGTSPFLRCLFISSTYGAFASTGVAWTGISETSTTPLDYCAFVRASVP